MAGFEADTPTPPLEGDNILICASPSARTKIFGTSLAMEERLQPTLDWCEQRRKELDGR